MNNNIIMDQKQHNYVTKESAENKQESKRLIVAHEKQLLDSLILNSHNQIGLLDEHQSIVKPVNLNLNSSLRFETS